MKVEKEVQRDKNQRRTETESKQPKERLNSGRINNHTICKQTKPYSTKKAEVISCRDRLKVMYGQKQYTMHAGSKHEKAISSLQ